MAKLDAKKPAGWNAGRNHCSRSFPVGDIVVDPEISGMFRVREETVVEIMERMEAGGYDRSQPVVLWKGLNIIVDGHTRLAAAKALGIEEIPAAELEFGSREEAILYCIERQVLRRNLTQAELLAAAQLIPSGRKEADGTGRAAEQLAERLGTSASTVYQARKVMLEASEDDIMDIQSGKKSIRSVYHRKLKKPKKESEVEKIGEGIAASPGGVPESVMAEIDKVILLLNGGLSGVPEGSAAVNSILNAVGMLIRLKNQINSNAVRV